jgi:iron-sulfur cluster repair protein YtfE (RIC family)
VVEYDSVIERLAHDHVVINELLDRMEVAVPPAQLATVHSQLMREVLAHERVEDQVLLPAMSDRGRCSGQRGTELWVDRIVEEHKEMGQLMSAMCGLDPAGPAFEKRSSALVFLMREHMVDEEEYMFPLLGALFTPGELAAMAEAAERARDAVMVAD